MAWTANNSLKTNPIVIEVFSSNITVSATPITIKTVTFNSAASTDRFMLQTHSATEVVTEPRPRVAIDISQNVTGGSVSQYFGEGGHTFPNLYFDTDATSQKGLGAGDRVLIYLK